MFHSGSNYFYTVFNPCCAVIEHILYLVVLCFCHNRCIIIILRKSMTRFMQFSWLNRYNWHLIMCLYHVSTFIGIAHSQMQNELHLSIRVADVCE